MKLSEEGFVIIRYRLTDEHKAEIDREITDEVTQLEAENEALRHTVEDLIVTMKQPAIRGAKTTLQMCKFLDVWILDLEDALLTKDE